METSNEKTSSRPDNSLDQALRPASWNEYVGQETIKKNLRILLRAAAKRNHQPEHVLFYGPPGLGKTTLAYLMTGEVGTSMRATSGPAIERVGDLASILTNLSPGSVLFIDEVHRLNKTIEEVLYPAMEAGVLDIVIGKGPSARTVQLELPAFTLVAATTRIALLSSPLRSRFSGGTFRLSFYSEKEIQNILERSAQILSISATQDALREISKRARRTPRTANYLLKRCRDYAQVHDNELDVHTVKRALSLLEIDALGLTQIDRDLLTIIIEKFGGGPIGLKTLAASLAEEEATIEEVHEPYLMRLGLLERTPRGRMATEAAFKHLGLNTPASAQKTLM